MFYGYARVSTADQSLDGQVAELREAGCGRVYSEKVSGAPRGKRKELERVIAKLADGDVLVVTRLDRLARSTRDLLNLANELAEKRAGLKSLADSWADTTSMHGRLMMTVLAGLAEFERELIVARTSAGRARAMEKGVKFGRKRKLTEHQRQEVIARRDAGETLTSIAKSYNVHHSMIARMETA
jgi:DNA invertase Pin-like site-specific DNA recombinase